MRVLQFPIGTDKLPEIGINTQYCLGHQFDSDDGCFDLINDGSGNGVKIENDISPNKITKNTGLILTAKDTKTMLRGLSKIKQDQTIVGDGGLCVVAIRHNDHGARTRKFLSNIPSFVKGRVKSKALHTAYPVVYFLAAAYTTIFKNKEDDNYYKTVQGVDKKFNKMNGGYQKVTFAEFKSAHDLRTKGKCVMVLVCLTRNLLPGEEGENFTVIRNINTKLRMGEFRAVVRRAFEGTDID